MQHAGSDCTSYHGGGEGRYYGRGQLVLMLAYGMALGAPVPLIASGAVGVKTYSEKTAHLGIWFKKVAGVLLVAFGIYCLLPWIWSV